jgi:YHS domain-containing protein
MPIDPVCTREVDLRTAHSMKVVDGRGIYFCSADCARAFSAQPEKYKDLNSHMRLTIGVMGSAADDEPTEARKTALTGRCGSARTSSDPARGHTAQCGRTSDMPGVRGDSYP